MKPFEERYTAWIDGSLSDGELAAFEGEIADRAAAEADKRDAHLLGTLLRTHGAAPRLTNGDFFNHQLMERITADERRPAGKFREKARFAWPLPHLAWATVCCLLLGIALFKTLIPGTVPPTVQSLSEVAQADADREWTYNAQVIEASTSDPGISVTALRSGPDNVSVLWIEGLDYLPASYELQ